LLLASCVGVEPQLAEATDASDAEHQAAARGLVYAREVCAGCHAVEVGEQSSPNPNAPSFTVIANMPGMTPTALNAWLHSAHASMPNLIVAPNDRADVAAYLQSIKHGDGAS
jgi:mono/diheme cytochrome c family protein